MGKQASYAVGYEAVTVAVSLPLDLRGERKEDSLR